MYLKQNDVLCRLVYPTDNVKSIRRKKNYSRIFSMEGKLLAHSFHRKNKFLPIFQKDCHS